MFESGVLALTALIGIMLFSAAPKKTLKNFVIAMGIPIAFLVILGVPSYYMKKQAVLNENAQTSMLEQIYSSENSEEKIESGNISPLKLLKCDKTTYSLEENRTGSKGFAYHLVFVNQKGEPIWIPKGNNVRIKKSNNIPLGSYDVYTLQAENEPNMIYYFILQGQK